VEGQVESVLNKRPLSMVTPSGQPKPPKQPKLINSSPVTTTNTDDHNDSSKTHVTPFFKGAN
jgi:hypothetical protein